MSESQSMESWIGNIRSRARRLEIVDVKVSDEEIIVVLTAGLPQTYSTVVDALDPDKLTLDFVITRLLNEEARQRLCDQTEIKKGGTCIVRCRSRSEGR